MKNEILSQKLKIMRNHRHMTQKDFAAYIGIPQPTLSAYENGKNNPTVDVIIEIADKCGVSLDWLCGREGRERLSDEKTYSENARKTLVERIVKLENDVYELKRAKENNSGRE